MHTPEGDSLMQHVVPGMSFLNPGFSKNQKKKKKKGKGKA
jgi:hypothetical protein